MLVIIVVSVFISFYFQLGMGVFFKELSLEYGNGNENVENAEYNEVKLERAE